MNVLIGCEFSGRVRDAFIAAGHKAASCDLRGSISPGPHFTGDIFEAIETNCHGYFTGQGIELAVLFPPCTFLCSSGARWWSTREDEQLKALWFVARLMGCGLPRWAIENPVGRISTAIRKPDQIIQPWQFGDGETKATCLWLHNLPLLVPDNVVAGRYQRVHNLPPGPERSDLRSMTYPGIARAMASQWGLI